MQRDVNVLNPVSVILQPTQSGLIYSLNSTGNKYFNFDANLVGKGFLVYNDSAGTDTVEFAALTITQTTVVGTNNSGQTTLNVASTAGFMNNTQIIINPGAATGEFRNSGSMTDTSFTMNGNLTNTHYANEKVIMCQRFTIYKGDLPIIIPALDFLGYAIVAASAWRLNVFGNYTP